MNLWNKSLGLAKEAASLMQNKSKADKSSIEKNLVAPIKHKQPGINNMANKALSQSQPIYDRIAAHKKANSMATSSSDLINGTTSDPGLRPNKLRYGHAKARALSGNRSVNKGYAAYLKAAGGRPRGQMKRLAGAYSAGANRFAQHDQMYARALMDQSNKLTAYSKLVK